MARRSGIYNTCYLQHDTKMTTMKSYGERLVRVCEIEREGARARERERVGERYIYCQEEYYLQNQCQEDDDEVVWRAIGMCVCGRESERERERCIYGEEEWYLQHGATMSLENMFYSRKSIYSGNPIYGNMYKTVLSWSWVASDWYVLVRQIRNARGQLY